MIERYTRPEMAEVWSDRKRYLRWLEVELAVCEEMARLGWIPAGEWKTLRSKGKALIKKGGVDPRRVERLEEKLRHDVIAFTTAVAEKIGPTSRWVHFGLTSSDVIDTAQALMIRDAGKVLVQNIKDLIKELRAQARRYKRLPTIGRSHGIYAEPTSFGLKFLGFATEWERNLERVKLALKGLEFGQLSGTIGVNAHFSPAQEARILRGLGLKREPVSTQVIPRDRHADFFNAMALCGASLERMAVEWRHLQRSEVSEVMEGFKKGQKGSSAMPHKRNPISTENLTGVARLLRGYAVASLENVALWHERDISHSSVERVALPDATILLNYGLVRMTGVVGGLVIRKDRVRRNLEDAGKISMSGHVLLELVKAGATREDGYYWVQECAHRALEGKGDFVDLLASHPKIKTFLSASKLKRLGSLDYQLRNVDGIYRMAKP